MCSMVLYHTGFGVIEKPDIRIGRRNADFGQGFYLSDDREFSKRWARTRKGFRTYQNAYELDIQGLRVKRFTRDAEWFGFIRANRSGLSDITADYDVIIGPVANDTLYDTWGIITGGQLSGEQALRLLMIGDSYSQIVIKTDKAAASLRFIKAVEINAEEIAAYREIVREEERRYQEEFVKLLVEMTGYHDEEDI